MKYMIIKMRQGSQNSRINTMLRPRGKIKYLGLNKRKAKLTLRKEFKIKEQGTSKMVTKIKTKAQCRVSKIQINF